MLGPFNKKVSDGTGGWPRRIAAIAGIAFVAVALRVAVGPRFDAAVVLATLRRVQESWWALPAFAVTYVVLTTAFFPAVVLHMAAGAAYGFGPGLCLNLVLFNATATAQFFAARRLGRERVAAFLAARGFTAVDKLFADHGLVSAILVRFLPLPAAAVAGSAGLSPLRARDFIIGSIVGALPYTAVYTYFASALVEGAAEASDRAFRTAAVATGAVVAMALVGTWIRARVRRRDELRSSRA
jgi:uncharacterized membrane protein YdjX (TVP38/TMEM64 family)